MTFARIKGALLTAGLAVTWTLSPGPVQAQKYPEKPIRIVVPIAAGGVADIAARALAHSIGDSSPHPIIVENRTGGASIPGTEHVAKAPADGYTFLAGFHSVLSILQHMQALPYDPEKDFVPVVNLVSVPNVLVVHPSVPANNLKELIAYAKANPGKLTYASQGIGTTGHLGGELLKQAAGIDIVHVPYKGAAPATNDLLGGHVHMMFNVIALAKDHIETKRARAIGMATGERLKAMPDVPTLVEQGLPVELTAWFGLVAPRGTPQYAIDWMNQAANKAFATPASQERFTSTGSSMPLGTPEDFGKHIQSERDRFGEVLRKAGIKP